MNPPQVNTSLFSKEDTASTNSSCAEQRAFNLSILGARSVLELCVGPSLRTLEQAYNKFNIKVFGNDIDPRWQKVYPRGNWIIGDACKINVSDFDAVVVAPPLSKGCSGKREDALSLEQVIPSYYSFIKLTNSIVVYVLPGKTLSIKEDRQQLYKFLSRLSGTIEIVPLINGVAKYIDIYRTNII